MLKLYKLNKSEKGSLKKAYSTSEVKKKEIKVCLNWLRFGKSKDILNLKNNNNSYGSNKKIYFQYADYFWTNNYSNVTKNNHLFYLENAPTIVGRLDYVEKFYTDLMFCNYFKTKLDTNLAIVQSDVIADSILKKYLKQDYKESILFTKYKLNGVSREGRYLKRKGLRSVVSLKKTNPKKKLVKFSKFLDTGLVRNYNILKKTKLIYSEERYWSYFSKDAQKKYFKNLGTAGFPVVDLIKRTQQLGNFPLRRKTSYAEHLLYHQFTRHPATMVGRIKKYITVSANFRVFDLWRVKKETKNTFAKFYGITWRYFKLKIEGFFYKQLGIRMHIWFLNVWDIFLNGLDSHWKWFRYENGTVRFLTRKGQRFLIESREAAKFFVRTLALTLTMVGGAKLFMDKVSLMLKDYRNNWAFILHVTKSLRFCVNFFWFRFFINYKVTLQGKIGGFLRAAKKMFKKGNITIEDRSSAITYYRGFPVTRFGAYNLSFWIQYRIPTLIGKFEELEYIDTMKVLLGTYSVPWLAQRLAGIISAILQDRVYKINLKVAQYDRRLRTRKKLYADVSTVSNYKFVTGEGNYLNGGDATVNAVKNTLSGVEARKLKVVRKHLKPSKLVKKK